MVAHAASAEPSAQRSLYLRALQDLDAGRIEQFRLDASQLTDYPLYPYLDYQELKQRLSQATPAEVLAFRERWTDSPIAGRLYDEWLDDLARRSEWALYLRYYEKSANVVRQCTYLRALDRSGDHDAAMEGVRPLWMVGTAQPKECDPLFAVWIQRGNVNNGMVWDRLTLALQARSWDLARYLAGLLTVQLRRQGETFYKVAREPTIVLDTGRFKTDDESTRAIVAFGLKRLARSDPDAAATAWASYRKTLSFGAEEARSIGQDITIGLAGRGIIDPNADLTPSDDDRHMKVSEALILASLNNRNWPCVISLIDGLDTAERATERWSYWLGRAQRAVSTAPPPTASECPAPAQPASARTAAAEPSDGDPWDSIANQRQYYGFLAADALGITPALNDQSSRPEPAQLQALQQRPAMLRIAELYAIGDRANARREWTYLTTQLDPQTLAVAPYVLAEMGWTYASILGAAKAPELSNDLSLRFPTPYTPTYVKASKASAVPIGFLYGIARQESAFDPYARSPAGALGLMQLMPATAAITARHSGDPAPIAAALFQPDLNVRIASRHIAELLERYEGNRVLAAAAYNAGAGRVDRWLRDRPARPADIWIESIPFAETRNYVQNVIAYAYVYGQRLGHPTRFLDSDER